MNWRDFVRDVAVTIAADEVLGWSDWLARKLVSLSARRVPPEFVERYEEEWFAHLVSLKGCLSRIWFGLSCCFASAVIAHEHFEPHEALGTAAMRRVFDLLSALVAVVCVAPLLTAIAVYLKLRDPHRSILDRQPMVGRGGRPFALLRFHCPQGHLGRVLRYTALNELPQLWNVARGEVRIIGGRGASRGP